MKNRLLLSVSVVALAWGSSALAADLPVKAPVYKAPVAAAYNWTGWYAGGNIGYGWGTADANYTDPGFGFFGLPTSFSASQNLNGIIGGGQIGYNWQADNTWVFGLEADFQGSGAKATASRYLPINNFEGISQSIEAKIWWFGTVRARAGVLVTPTIWAYATGGLAYGNVSASGTVTDTSCIPTCSWAFSNSKTNVGWTVGAGVEGAIPNTREWTWKIEYLYLDLGSISGTGVETDFGTTYSWSAKFTNNIIRAGINYRFQ